MKATSITFFICEFYDVPAQSLQLCYQDIAEISPSAFFTMIFTHFAKFIAF